MNWNQGLKERGVEVFQSYPSISKVDGGCQIDLSQFIPKAISLKQLSYYNEQSSTNCHGSTRFISGLSDRLEGDLTFSIPAEFKNLCREVLSPQELKAGDIGLVQGESMGEIDKDIHTFTVLTETAVIQSPNIEIGQYPRIFPFQSPIEQYVTKIKNPELNPTCLNAGTDKSQCQTWIRFYRCDFKRPSCAVQDTNSCSSAAEKIIQRSQAIRDLQNKVRASNTWEELSSIALNSPSTSVKEVIKEYKSFDSLTDSIEKKALSFAILDLDKLRGVLDKQISKFDQQGMNRPSTLGPNAERLHSGLGFSSDLPKQPDILIDYLTCLHVKLLKSEDTFRLENCKKVFDQM